MQILTLKYLKKFTELNELSDKTLYFKTLYLKYNVITLIFV